MNTIFKTIILTATFALTTCFGLSAAGQSYTNSSHHTFQFLDDCDTAFTRSYKGSSLVTCANLSGTSITNAACFIIRDELSTTAKILYIPRYNNHIGAMTDHITDMKILNGICYFCGTRIIPIEYSENTRSFVHDTVGFVGHFSIEDVLNGSGYYYWEDFSEVSSFSKMAVTDKVDAADAGLMIIGTRKDVPNNTCLACIKQPSSSNLWKYYITDTDIDNEIFTDVITTEWLWVTASIIKDGTDSIIFRHTKIGNFGFYDESFSGGAPLESLFRISYLGIYRRKNTPVLLCSMYNDNFSAGFSSFNPEQGVIHTIGNIYVMHMAYPNSMQQVHSIQTEPGSTIKDLTYLPNIHSTATLHRSRASLFDHTQNNYLQCVCWNKTEEYCDTAMHLSNGQLLSLDTYQGGFVALGGQRNTYKPTDVIQRFYGRQNSCLLTDGCKTIDILSTTIPDYIKSSFSNITDELDKGWVPHAFESATGTAVPCTH